MIDIIISVLLVLFLCWFIRAVYTQRLAMEEVYHWDEDHAQEQEEAKSSSLSHKIDEMEI